ncbi:hypothetical protein GCM10010960_19550 [Arenimonas maotaiensis]|uniref:DUF4870 domain-containing protein n=1 Tax=Arenimonas maotaiensis TaxID=1446479 RepID=A0A917CU90_9GAMM|nr:DUF4870 domain-containing protein [Arenimonas maotaiensis]GGF97935.1 hypothetical protein GCM10010960_19550 [Arenimonas maotaiensis]
MAKARLHTPKDTVTASLMWWFSILLPLVAPIVFGFRSGDAFVRDASKASLNGQLVLSAIALAAAPFAATSVAPWLWSALLAAHALIAGRGALAARIGLLYRAPLIPRLLK